MTIVSLVSTFFGCGRFPFAPGTFASAVALVLCGLLNRYVGWYGVWILALLACILGWATAGKAARQAGVTDPGFVVIDEVAGMAIAVVTAGSSLIWMGVAFLGFRTLDIWKPWPVGATEKFPGSTGIMMDDVVAGVIVALVIGLIRLSFGI